jgi:uncharacterized damage-inducible protein DinB
MITNPWLAQFDHSWQFTRSLTLDFLAGLSEENLSYSPQLEFGTIGKLIRHVGDVQEVYACALQTGTVDFSLKRRDYTMETSLERLNSYLQEQDKKLHDILSGYEKDPLKEMIQWPTEKLSVLEHLFLLPQHEAIHQGQWSLAARQAGIDLPKSWKDSWGL